MKRREVDVRRKDDEKKSERREKGGYQQSNFAALGTTHFIECIYHRMTCTCLCATVLKIYGEEQGNVQRNCVDELRLTRPYPCAKRDKKSE